MNKVILIGRLVADPDVRNMQSNSSVASYRLAVDRQYKKDGQPTADFIPCVAFGKSAEFVEKYLHKGTKIAVEGRIQIRSYENDGVKHYITEVIVDRHEFCESRNAAQTSYTAQATVDNVDNYAEVEDDGTPLPF